jgi:hypothetical protein
MAVTILAGAVEIDIVVGALDGRDGEAKRRQCREKFFDQRGFAGAGPAGDAEQPPCGQFRTPWRWLAGGTGARCGVTCRRPAMT